MLIALLFAFAIYATDSKCPKDTIEAVFNPAVCYYYGSQNMTYMNAEIECQMRHGNLIKTRNMLEDIYLSRSVTSDFWFGLRKRNSNEWVWANGTKLMYSNWRIGEPKEDKNANCGAVAFAGGKWLAQDCMKEKPFVCSLKNRNYNIGRKRFKFFHW